MFVVKEQCKVSDLLNVTVQSMDQLSALQAPAICLHKNATHEQETIIKIKEYTLQSIQVTFRSYLGFVCWLLT